MIPAALILLFVASASGAEPKCRPESFDLAAFMKELDAGRLPERAPVDDVIAAVMGLHTCRAFVRSKPEICGLDETKDKDAYGEDSIPPGMAPDEVAKLRWRVICRAHLNELRFMRAWRTKADDFVPLCAAALEETARYEEREFRDEDLPKVCGILERRRVDPLKTCAELAPLYLTEKAKGRCARTVGRLHGRVESCELYNAPRTRERCLEYAAYRRAHAAKDVKLCGPAPLCRALMGQGEASCRPYLDRLARLASGCS